jgi:hypothetical protein
LMDQRGRSDKPPGATVVDGHSDVQHFPREGNVTSCEVALDVGNRRSYEWVKVTYAECDPASADWPDRFARVARSKARHQRFGEPVLADITCLAIASPFESPCGARSWLTVHRLDEVWLLICAECGSLRENDTWKV